MDLNIDLRLKGRSRPVRADFVRELRTEDLVLLGDEKGSAPSQIKRLSDRHHHLARTLAAGVPPGKAAVICGYDASRVSILLGDPTFKELLAFYRDEVGFEYRNLAEQLAGLSMDAIAEIRARLEETPDKIGLNALLDILKLTADRTGHAPKTEQTVNVNIGIADRLEAARRRVLDLEVVNAKQIAGATPTDVDSGS